MVGLPRPYESVQYELAWKSRSGLTASFVRENFREFERILKQ